MGVKGLFSQRNTGKRWGTIIQVVQQESIFISLTILSLQVVAVYPTLHGWFAQWGIYIPFWLFALTIICGVLFTGAMVVWKYSLPSYFSAFNDQFYRHDNLLRRDIEELKKANTEILELLGKK